MIIAFPSVKSKSAAFFINGGCVHFYRTSSLLMGEGRIDASVRHTGGPNVVTVLNFAPKRSLIKF